MVTSYYIMKMSKSKNSSDITGDYYNKLQNATGFKNIYNRRYNLKCRVCLKDGFESIYGLENTSDIIEALKTCGNIEVNEDDDYPKQLCTVCYKFIKNAILFRNIAKQTDKTLKECVKVEPSCSYQEDGVSLDKTENDSIKEKNPESQGETKFESGSNLQKKHNAKVQCSTCKKIIRKSYYTIHKTMHDPDHHKYICDICGKTFRLRVGYHNHRLRHRTDYPYKCQLCPFKGRYAERLKSHMRTHSGEYRYMCTECPARFLFKGNFNSHVLLKHRDPEFNCESCGRAFHTKLLLQRHCEVDHLGIKSHVCNICGRAFGYRNAMMKHQRRVHKREKLRFSYKPDCLNI